MKRYLLVALSVVFALASYSKVMAQETTDVESQHEVLGIHPFKSYPYLSDDFTHWSISIEGGLSLVDADFVQPKNTIVPKTKLRPTVGISLEYNFTPTWGLMMSYNYGNYGVKFKGEEKYALLGHMHIGQVFVTYDLIDAWFPYRKKNIFSFYLMAGVGMGFYNCDYRETSDAEPVHPLPTDKYKMTGVIGLGALAEFNLTRELAIGLRGTYHIYTVDDIDAKIQGTNNDCMEFATMNLRWKIGGHKKNHVRNYASEAAFLAAWNGEDVYNPKKGLQKDTVVIINNDTVRIESRDTIVVVQQQQQVQQVQNQQVVKEDKRVYVYFDHDKSELNERALINILEIAQRLQEDTTIYVEVNGYCDDTGSSEYNYALGQRRADAVVRELTTVYGISADRFLPVSRGKISNVKKSYGPNRRVELRFTTKDEMRDLKQQNSQKQAAKSQEVIAKAQQSDSKANAQQATSQQYLDKVTAQKDVTTLAQLARKYYNNVYCWAYIFEANESVLTHPDRIPEGVELVIPELSAEQLQPSAVEAKRREIEKRFGK